jgi:prepilin-type processing-associated H-X9-DG protein
MTVIMALMAINARMANTLFPDGHGKEEVRLFACTAYG